MRISDWSSDVCSSDLAHDLKNPLTSVLFASDILVNNGTRPERIPRYLEMIHDSAQDALGYIKRYLEAQADSVLSRQQAESGDVAAPLPEVLAWLSRRYGLQLESRGVQMRVQAPPRCRSEEHTSELQSLMRISYAVFCLKKT